MNETTPTPSSSPSPNVPFDAASHRALLARIAELTDGDRLPAVSLEEFFDGNRDAGSIGCNLTNHPGVPHFQGILQAVRNRADVQTIVVPIYEVLDGDDSSWPFAETVLVYTTASRDEIERAVDSLRASEVYDGVYGDVLPAGAPKVEEGHRVLTVWWD